MTEEMTEPYHEIDMARLVRMTGVSQMTELSNDFVITPICGRNMFDLLRYPVRLNAYAAIYCTKGHFDIDVNITTYRICEDTMLLYMPGSTLHFKETEFDNLQRSEAVLVACTREFMKGGRINFNGLFERSVRLLSNPCITLDESGKKILSDYYSLVSDLYRAGLEGTGDAICSIGTSLFCLLGNIWNGELSKNGDVVRPKSRAQAVYEEFLSIVSENFMSGKGLGFYAEKMCITPKYLTTVVKAVSGKTAMEWIDTFTVLEAKNLLKYSDLSVKEIGYSLHFSSIPSFHKFFKRQTGMTPNEYRSGRSGEDICR